MMSFASVVLSVAQTGAQKIEVFVNTSKEQIVMVSNSAVATSEESLDSFIAPFTRGEMMFAVAQHGRPPLRSLHWNSIYEKMDRALQGIVKRYEAMDDNAYSIIAVLNLNPFPCITDMRKDLQDVLFVYTSIEYDLFDLATHRTWAIKNNVRFWYSYYGERANSLQCTAQGVVGILKCMYGKELTSEMFRAFTLVRAQVRLSGYFTADINVPVC